MTWPTNPNSPASTINWPVPTGAVLVGFQGHSGDWLNQLAPVYLQFQPAIWAPSSSDAQYIPAGSYQGSSSDITIQIQAQCTSESGSQVASSLTYTTTQATTIGDIGNNNGVLTIVNT